MREVPGDVVLHQTDLVAGKEEILLLGLCPHLESEEVKYGKQRVSTVSRAAGRTDKGQAVVQFGRAFDNNTQPVPTLFSPAGISDIQRLGG